MCQSTCPPATCGPRIAPVQRDQAGAGGVVVVEVGVVVEVVVVTMGLVVMEVVVDEVEVVVDEVEVVEVVVVEVVVVEVVVDEVEVVVVEVVVDEVEVVVVEVVVDEVEVVVVEVVEVIQRRAAGSTGAAHATEVGGGAAPGRGTPHRRRLIVQGRLVPIPRFTPWVFDVGWLAAGAVWKRGKSRSPKKAAACVRDTRVSHGNVRPSQNHLEPASAPDGLPATQGGSPGSAAAEATSQSVFALFSSRAGRLRAVNRAEAGIEEEGYCGPGNSSYESPVRGHVRD
ncbi:unnamed protein product [Arctogadus glacialis]